MKIIWLCNAIIPQVCEKLGIQNGEVGGWLNQLAELIDEQPDIELYVCAPFVQGKHLTKVKWGQKGTFYGFQKKYWDPVKYDSTLEPLFKDIISEVNPDIVHIFGTEYPHTLAMVRAFGNPERTVIHIQGIISEISKYYCAFLPQHVTRAVTFRDFVRRDNIIQQKKKFAIRGNYEIEALQNVGHVMGRTDWDRACVHKINPNVKYHYVQEMMRKEFYSGKWEYDFCEKHSVFMSQGGYPIKGLHLMFEALNLIRRDYPDVKLYVAGDNITDCSGFSKRIRQSYYSKYICKLMDEYGLWESVEFTGRLNAGQMKEQYLKSNVFVSASAIENSPNSIGEALLLGVPIVSSNVGGVSSLMRHEVDRYLYPADEPDMLAYYIMVVFQNMNGDICLRPIKDANELYRCENIVKQLTDAYNEIFL